jgi:hypothetical protein
MHHQMQLLPRRNRACQQRNGSFCKFPV